MSRPRKVILMVDANEQRISERCFLLDIRLYRVLVARTAAKAIMILELRTAIDNPYPVDLVIADLLLPSMDGNELALSVKLSYPAVPVLLFSDSVSDLSLATAADYFLPKEAQSPVELLEKIRVLIARKRGPRRKIVPGAVDPEGSLVKHDDRRAA